MNYIKFHTNFVLNGKSFKSVEELLSFSKSISLEVFSFLDDWLAPNDFIVVKTSGSTGNPTTIQLKKEYMMNSAIATGKYFDLQNNTKALLCLSPNYIAGKMMLVRALVLGWHLDVIEPSSHPLEDIVSTYDFCAMVPGQLRNSLSKLHHIKKLIVGGAAISNELVEKLQEHSTKVYATYGMTETITHIAIKKLNNFEIDNLKDKDFDSVQPDTSAPSSAADLSMQVRQPARQGGTTWQSHKSNYIILPNVKISTDNRDRLIINAPKVSDKQIITNDIVRLISEFEFEWLGRYDTIINSGGVKLIPEQIEKKLSVIIKGRFFVAGVPDEVLGEKLVLIIEGEKTSNFISDELKSLISLHRYETPKEIFFIDRFIETETKKIQRPMTLDLIFKK